MSRIVRSLRRAAPPLVAALLLAGPALAGCSSSEPAESAADLLARAKKTLDAAPSVHFTLESEGAPTTGSGVVGGEGDIARPSSFRGTLQALVSGATVDLKVVSVDGTFYAQLPFTQSYQQVDPAQFGFGDPGRLLDPETGISQLLTEAKSAKLGAEKRVDGELAREVTADLPGDLVQQILTSQDPSKPVAARFSIATESGELRRAALTGPFFTAGDDATYTLDLSKFGADVTITAPPTG
jgi:LppX_LprAFG lipoprotein